jgi:cell division transport system permease protein
MIPLRYFTREGLHIVGSNKKISFLAMGVIALALFFMGFFFLITNNLRTAEEAWRKQQKMVVYLADQVPQTDREALEKLLASKAFVRRHAFQSAEEAYRRFQADFPSLGEVLDASKDNPFSPSYELELEPGHEAEAKALLTQLEKTAGVAEVQYDTAWLQKLNSFVFFLRWFGIALGVLLGFGAIIIVTNVVRIATLVHRDEIEILWLVGAPPQYIRGPFLLQGIILGLGGGVLSLLLLAGVYQFFSMQVKGHFQVLWNFLTLSFLPASTLAILLACGVLCGLLGSLMFKFEDNASEG